jgi:methylglutaconyl-CoA hydratase
MQQNGGVQHGQKRKGSMPKFFDSIETMDEAVDKLAVRLSNSNPEAMKDLKKIFWQGTSHWDDLLEERAGISGRLVLSEFTRNAISAFKSK